MHVCIVFQLCTPCRNSSRQAPRTAGSAQAFLRKLDSHPATQTQAWCVVPTAMGGGPRPVLFLCMWFSVYCVLTAKYHALARCLSQAAEVEETLKRIRSHRGVEGILIINNDGVALKSTMSAEQTAQYSAEMSRLCAMARSSVRTLDSGNDLTFLRIRSKKHEVMVAPGASGVQCSPRAALAQATPFPLTDKDYMLIVVQNPNAEEGAAEAPAESGL